MLKGVINSGSKLHFNFFLHFNITNGSYFKKINKLTFFYLPYNKHL